MMKETKQTWEPGDTVNYYGSNAKLKITNGLYFYGGFGMGSLYLNGKSYSGCPSAACMMCEDAKVKYKYVDSFSGYVPTYLGD
jgi:hypothetical protein